MAIKCPNCDKQMRNLACRAWLFQCDVCGLLGSTLEASIPEVVSASVVDEVDREQGLITVRTINNLKILDYLKEQGAGQKMLDVGSGLGFFLRTATERGFDVLGIEPDANVVQRARLSGSQVRQGFFPDCLEGGDLFDVIVFNDVLEHIPDAMAAVKSAAQHLSPNGILVLNCPDQRGIFYKLSYVMDRIGFGGGLDRMWQTCTPSPHRWYFSSEILARLGEKAGLFLTGDIPLQTISKQGLFERVFHIRTQSAVVSWFAYISARVVLPFLSYFPPDVRAVFLKKL